MSTPRKRLSEAADWITSKLDFIFYVYAGYVAVSGLVTGYLASLNDWIASYGPLGYWSAGMTGALVATLTGAGFARLRLWWIEGNAVNKWKDDVVGVNPLDHQFTGLRLRMSDFVHPVRREIANKTFIECELMGPINVCLMDHMHITGAGLLNCDIIVAGPDIPIFTAVRAERLTILRGTLVNWTIIIPPNLVPIFQQMGAQFVTPIAGAQPTPQLPQGTAQGTPQ